MPTSKRSMMKERRKAICAGMREISQLSSTEKPEYLFQISKQKTKTRVAKMIEVLRRSDPQFEAILKRHLYSDEVIISS